MDVKKKKLRRTVAASKKQRFALYNLTTQSHVMNLSSSSVVNVLPRVGKKEVSQRYVRQGAESEEGPSYRFVPSRKTFISDSSAR